jgi:predicted alpha/beta-hydrolase family hydrolase
MSETPDILLDGPAEARHTLALAHGAGVGMDSPFMQAFASTLADHRLRVARFEFPYMAARRQDGKKRPPNAEAKLKACWRAVIDALDGPEGLVIGGKSMGGRMASLVAADLEAADTPVAGLVCRGEPVRRCQRLREVPGSVRAHHRHRPLASHGVGDQRLRERVGVDVHQPGRGAAVCPESEPDLGRARRGFAPRRLLRIQLGSAALGRELLDALQHHLLPGRPRDERR